MTRCLIATSNPHKYREMASELSEVGLETVSLEDLDLRLERPESGETYRQNARIKADEGFEKSGVASLADDSGLEVYALDGAPGIHSDRWVSADASAQRQNQYLLERLNGVPPERRGARYVCEMVLVDESGLRFSSRGVCEGRISETPRGEGGFGYDPLFEVKEADYRTFAELPPRYKQSLSHRARALHQMIDLIREECLKPE